MAATAPKFSAAPIDKVLDGIELSEASAPQRRAGDDARALFERLAGAGLVIDALKVAAAALPKREAVWLALRCVQSLANDATPPAQRAALDAARAWVDEPNDERRRATNVAAEKAGLDKPFGCVALAAYMSGGSLGPPDVPPIPPAEFLCGVASGLALEIALRQVPRAETSAVEKRFLALAREVDQQRAPWDAAPAAAAAPAPPPARTPRR
jgi:hypothetical protein